MIDHGHEFERAGIIYRDGDVELVYKCWCDAWKVEKLDEENELSSFGST